MYCSFFAFSTRTSHHAFNLLIRLIADLLLTLSRSLILSVLRDASQWL